jgi:hypothetical protein
MASLQAGEQLGLLDELASVDDPTFSAPATSTETSELPSGEFVAQETTGDGTEDEIGYGEAISGLTNGSHYMIDASRYGAGPAPDSDVDWCNPSGRALGTPPTAATAGAHADAYLWIKRPGESRLGPGPRCISRLRLAFGQCA